jgi:hypothetical protein
VDILFVSDNSGSMMVSTWEWCSGGAFGAIGQFSEEFNIHVGVVSTNLGSGTANVDYCGSGDGGVLGTFGSWDSAAYCLGSGRRFLIETEPVDCTIERLSTPPGACAEHDCTQDSCDAVTGEPETLSLREFSMCPRCANYQAGSSLSMGTDCMVRPGPPGCGFTQPLEAMRLALDRNPANVGFLRQDAHLLVVFITDEDDCSVGNAAFWDTEQDSMDAPLGYFSSYRCFEFGVTCDINDRTHEGERNDCRPRDDPDALLYPISRYADFLRELKDPQMLTLAATAGPVEGGTVTVRRDSLDRPTVFSNGSAPGIRIRSLLQAFHDEFDLAWAYQSVEMACWGFFSDVADSVARRLLENDCLPKPLAGCPDPGVEQGTPQAAVPCGTNSRCLARCEVTDVRRRGTAEETRVELPACLSVQPDGTVDQRNYFKELAYQGGYPAERDGELPVDACWSIIYDLICNASRGAALRVSRRVDPPPRTFVEVTCDALSDVETECKNGRDDDEDCLVDLDDPDCGAR